MTDINARKGMEKSIMDAMIEKDKDFFDIMGNMVEAVKPLILEEQVEEWFGAIQITKAYARDLVERAKQILEDFRSNSDNETQTITIRQSKIEAAMREAEDNWLIKKNA